MNTGIWHKPITFETSMLGKYWTVTSTAEAARALLDRWPVHEGRAYTRAKAACLAVLAGDADPALARAAFLKAAEEADVFVRP